METKTRKLSALAFIQHYLPGFGLEKLIESIPADVVSERNKQIAIRYFLHIEDMENIAADNNLSRERCRQIAERVQNIAGAYIARSMELRAKSEEKDQRIKNLEWELNQVQVKLKFFHQLTAPANFIEDIGIENLDMSVRLFNTLKSNKYDTIGKIKTLSGETFMELRNSGKRTFEELQQILSMYQIKWPADV